MAIDTSSSVSQTIRVLVVDNTRIHAQLLADALRRDSAMSVIGAVSHSQDLINTAKEQRIDVAVIGCNLDEQPLQGIEALRQLRGLRPDVKAIVLLDSSKRETVIEAFRAGARGLFTRHESLEMLSKCVRRVFEGQIWANTEQVGFAIEALAGSPTVRAVGANGMELLSRRELEVVRCLAEGLSNREIAKRLGLSQHTIKNYLFRVFDKLGVSSRLELLSLTLTRPNLQAPDSSEKNANSPVEGLEATIAAAEQGSPSAQVALAWRYWQGKGLPADPVAAFTWYLLSERSSEEIKDEVGAARRKLADTMTNEQIMEAQRRAAEKLRKAPNTAALSAGKRS